MLRPVARSKKDLIPFVRVGGLTWHLKRSRRRGPVAVAAFWYQQGFPGMRRMHDALARRLYVLKPNMEPAVGTGKLACDDPLAFAKLPNWRSFLLDQTYDGGKDARQPGLLIVCARSGSWQWTLKEASSCLMLKVSTRTWDEGVLVIEELLADPKAPWETDAYEAGKKARSRGRRP